MQSKISALLQHLIQKVLVVANLSVPPDLTRLLDPLPPANHLPLTHFLALLILDW